MAGTYLIVFFIAVLLCLLVAFCLDVRFERRRRRQLRLRRKRDLELREAYIDLLNKQSEDYREALRLIKEVAGFGERYRTNGEN